MMYSNSCRKCLQEALHRPRGGVAERADRVAFDLVRPTRRACRGRPSSPWPCDDARRARGTSSRCLRGTACTGRTTRRSRSARGAGRRCTMQVVSSITITAPEPRPEPAFCDRVVVHRERHHRVGRQHRHRRAARDHGLELAARCACRRPSRAAPRTACRAGSRSCRACSTWPDTEKIFGAAVVRLAQVRGTTRAPLRMIARHRRERLGVVDRGRLAVQAEARRERRLEARLALLAFERLEQRGLLAADVGAGAVARCGGRSRSRCRGCSCRGSRPRTPPRALPRSARNGSSWNSPWM